MKRAITVVAGTAAFVAAIGAGASADDVVTAVVDRVDDAVVVDHPGGPVTGGGTGGGTGGVGRDVNVGSAVVGYVSIVSNETTGLPPTYDVHGALDDPTQWSCSGSGSAASFSVRCVPVPLVLPVAYRCDVLHADATTSSPNASARATLDCDGDGTGEVATETVTGVGGHDSKWSVDGRSVTAFTCTLDNGAGDYAVGCGDPGLVTVQA